MKITSLIQLYDNIPDKEKIIMDVLRQIIIEHLGDYGNEKLSYNVPFFYGQKGICIVWPASISRGGFSDGILLGFWNGYLLKDKSKYLDRGTNKKVFYKIFRSIDDINQETVSRLLSEAIELDKSFQEPSV